ncbi:MAG: hypothetical protein BSOLF_1958 [Candidatus Carbobacillus altaicus]|uniref:Uncharacterized protein n=1 Tax=Candidatus Carbonibacillus altaicus TaxID=2163959 RepID=A0A2R6XYH1_9BACL|nr:MAG: hypothetical protein BSOLF_1958 [Candidatus Carbobacillus altaicus]
MDAEDVGHGITPRQCLPVQVIQIREPNRGPEVPLDVLDAAFHPVLGQGR